jgi:hypothetical protein
MSSIPEERKDDQSYVHCDGRWIPSERIHYDLNPAQCHLHWFALTRSAAFPAFLFCSNLPLLSPTKAQSSIRCSPKPLPLGGSFAVTSACKPLQPSSLHTRPLTADEAISKRGVDVLRCRERGKKGSGALIKFCCGAWLGVMVNARIRQSYIVASRQRVLTCKCHRLGISARHLSTGAPCSSTSLESLRGGLPKSVYQVKSGCAGQPTSS